MRGEPAISPIWRMVPSPGPDPERAFARLFAWCRDLWTDHGTIVAKPNELPDHLREQMVAWANETYGRRAR